MNTGQPLLRRGITLIPVALLLLGFTNALAQGTVSGRVTAQASG